MNVNIKEKIKHNLGSLIPLLASIILILILLLIPTGYEDAVIYRGTDRTIAKVSETDESKLLTAGVTQSGEQSCSVELLGGRFKGKKVKAINMLNGSLEQDKLFFKGDRSLIVISYDGDEIKSVNMIDHFRIDKEILILAIFAVLLLLFAGSIGLRALLSFVVTVLMIWKVLIPGYLRGYNPIIMGIIITIVLAAITISMVYGLNKKALSAVLGAVLGIITTAAIGIVFTDMFKIHGAVMPHSESLLYSSSMNLNLTQIFMSSIFIGSAGAVMDLAVDITSAVYEVVEKKPDISWREAAGSGINVGKAALGTMTTTLLLAYSGGYVSLLMVFMAQGTPIDNILNYKYVAAEILDTVVGSIGLVTVAPFTAIISGYLLAPNKIQKGCS